MWGALAAKRGVIATVERIVDDIRPWSHLVAVPAHRVLAVTEAPMGAHPGGLFSRDTPVDPYGEDLDFWTEAGAISHAGGEAFDDWIRHWVLDPVDQADYVSRIDPERIALLRRRAEPDSWQDDEAANPPDLDAPVNAWERAAAYGAAYLADRVLATEADAVLAGAGVANLAAWLAVEVARRQGSDCVLTAELGLWGYEPTPADPFVFNHRSFPSATMMGDVDQVLGMLVGSPGTTLLACLGAAQIDRFGNINSTVIGDRTFLVGSGGGNDVATAADEVVVMSTLTSRRLVAEVPYITSPGVQVRAFVTDLGVFEKQDDGVLGLVAGRGRARERSTSGWRPSASVARGTSQCPTTWSSSIRPTRPTSSASGIGTRWDAFSAPTPEPPPVSTTAVPRTRRRRRRTRNGPELRRVQADMAPQRSES